MSDHGQPMAIARGRRVKINPRKLAARPGDAKLFFAQGGGVLRSPAVPGKHAGGGKRKRPDKAKLKAARKRASRQRRR